MDAFINGLLKYIIGLPLHMSLMIYVCNYIGQSIGIAKCVGVGESTIAE